MPDNFSAKIGNVHVPDHKPVSLDWSVTLLPKDREIKIVLGDTYWNGNRYGGYTARNVFAMGEWRNEKEKVLIMFSFRGKIDVIAFTIDRYQNAHRLHYPIDMIVAKFRPKRR